MSDAERPAAEPVGAFAGDGRRVLTVIAAVIAPTTLVTAVAFYFGWRRERAFAGFFGIDSSTLGLSTSDYVLRSVDALFVPAVTVLLVLFAAVAAGTLLAGRFARPEVPPILALAGTVALFLAVLLAAGHPVTSDFIYLQALGAGVGALLIAEALALSGAAAPGTLARVRFVAVAVVLLSLFWATSEYADSRGLSLARRLAADLTVNPQVTIFSSHDLDIHAAAYDQGCTELETSKLKTGAYRYRYKGLTLLLRSGGNYFLTPTPGPQVPWKPQAEAVLIVPDDARVRLEFRRGVGYKTGEAEKTAAGSLAFTC